MTQYDKPYITVGPATPEGAMWRVGGEGPGGVDEYRPLLSLGQSKVSNMIFWKTRDGRCVNVMEMEQRHLLNCLSFAARQLEDAESNFFAAATYDGRGEMATYYADQSAEQSYDDAARAAFWVKVFNDEIQRRKSATLD